MRIFNLYILVVLFLSSSVQAREEFWYFGAGGGATFLEDKDELFTDIDEKSTTVKAYVGYRVSTYIALEIDYAYYGEYDYQGILGADATPGTSGTAEYSALSASIVVMYPLIWDGIELYTPIGLSLIDTKTDIKDKTTGGYKLGFGVAYTPSFSKHFTMRVGTEILVFDLEGEDEDFKQNLASAYVTLQYNF
ncbi:MAG: hypothetical protein COA44_00775 [Arcobacter sp.]|nr:MAG: hypothetical protein COA44_00775 [Arcobacter sp.]